jgi:hypothetical protein
VVLFSIVCKRIGDFTDARQRAGPAVPHRPAVVENLLKLSGRRPPLCSGKIGLTFYVAWVKAGILLLIHSTDE